MIEDRAPLRDDPDAALRRRLVQQAAVASLGRAALGGSLVAALMPLAVALVADGLGTELAAILRHDERLDALVCRHSVGWTPEMVRPVPLVADSQLAATYLTGEPGVVADLAGDPSWPASRHLLAHGIVSAISVPIATAERGYGVLAAHSRTPLGFDRDDLAFLDGVANVLGSALHAEEAAAARELDLDRSVRLQRAASALGGAAGRDEVLAILIEHGRAASGAELALVALDAGDGQAFVAAEHGYGSQIERWTRFPIDEEYPAGHAMLRGDAVYCANRAERDARFPSMVGEGPPGSHALAVLPLLGAGGPLGALALGFADERGFDADERRFLETLAAQCAQALERAETADRTRRLAEDLAFERERLRAVLEQMPSGVVLADADGRLVLANPQVEAIWGRPLPGSTQVQGTDAFRGFHRSGRPYAPDEWPLARTLREGKTVQGEEVAIERGDGSRAFLSVSSAPIRDADGSVLAGVAIFSEVTGEVEAREAAERRADAAAALGFVADGICLVDELGAVRLWNDGARRVTGVPAEAVLGGPIDDALPGWRHLEPQIPVADAGDDPPRPLTLPLEVGGEERWLSISGVRFEGGAVFAFRDETEEHALETMKSDFIATVSHELRTPLSAVYGAAATLRTRAGLGPGEREQFLLMIEQQSERLSRIVNEILTASRVETGAVSVDLRRLDGPAVAQDVVRMVRRGAGAGFELVVLADPRTPPVVADPDRLRQVLANLVENAVKYSADSRRVEVAIDYADAFVRFAVRDFGIGIPPSERERIFAKFYRVDPAMSGGVSGTGLGLYIVRELVDRMRGRLRVEETAGGGSTFVVELPAA